MRQIARFALAAALLMLPLAAHAGPLHWTAVGVSAAVEPASILDAGFANGGFSFLNGSTGTVVQGYWNVTNTTGTETPAWTTLEVDYSQPANSTVQILFFEVDPCTGARRQICNFFGVSGAQKVCKSCSLPSGTFDFANKLYVVEASITRTTTQNNFPTVWTVRIY